MQDLIKKREDIITQFKGKTFSSNEDVIAWIDKKLKSFEDSVIEEVIKEMQELLENGHGGGNWRRLIIQLINKLKSRN